MHTPAPVRITRRQVGLWLGAGALSAGHGTLAQTLSEAALEAQAPALPRLGSVLQVPDIALLDGQRRVVLAEKGQMFAEDVEAIAQRI